MIHLIGLALYAATVSGVAAYKKSIARKKQTESNHPPQSTALATISAEEEEAKAREAQNKEEEAAMDRYLAYGGTAFALSAAGLFLYPPLGLVSVIPLALASESMFQELVRRIKNREKNIVYLDTIGILMGIGTGFYALSALTQCFYIGSQKMLLQTRDRTHKRFANLFTSKQQDVWLLKDGAEICVKLDTLQIGDLIVVNTGEIVPVDGVIVHGLVTIDQHMLTGESQPEEKAVGDRVMATTLVVAGRVTVKIEQAGADTIAANIALALDRTESYISDIQTHGEVVANNSITPTVALSGIALVARGSYACGLALSSNFSEVMRVMQPMTMLNFLHLASSGGVLVKDGRSLEQLQTIDTVVFDKTGTLTSGEPHVMRVFPCDGYSEDEIIHFAATAEFRQSHPIARAVQAVARDRGIDLHSVDEAEYHIGLGLSVKVAGRHIKVGSRRFMVHEGVLLDDWFTPMENSAHQAGHSLLCVAVDDRLAGVLELAPTLRPETVTVIHRLQKRGLRVLILSGDHVEPVRKLAADLGVDEFYAQTLPEEKAAVIERLHAEGRRVCFVGDGINDSIALKRAAVSVSIQDGSDIARDSAQIVLMGGNLLQLLDVIELAEQYNRQHKITTAAVAIPSFASMGGVLLFGLGMPYVLALYMASAAAGVTVATLPLLRGHKPTHAPLSSQENEDTLQ
ncbi:heavy metal translocating P-type ATPase [Propionivibrio sp.]|jgi:Cu2+-exporting ATPase|uniref:heavy metal translocating P-type ATPase n=1 Tax=Propionivibrio sp. TaxID=2212460 RepID=UPI003BF26B08